MKSLVLSLVILSTALPSHAQRMTFKQLLDSGKAEYRRQYTEPASDFQKCYDLFLEAVQRQPASAEAHYWLGHAIDRMNMADGTTMNKTNRELTIKASEQFELVNRMEKRYTGEFSRLDPYSKLTGIWGSQALAYLDRGDRDSLMWAFREGRRRGAFNDGILEYDRQLLESCSPNAVFLTSGDNITLPILYLQEVEGFRKDVCMVDINLAGTRWYPEYIRRTSPIQFTYNDPVLDSMGYREWTAQEQVIVNEANKQEFIKWLLKPTYYDNFVIKSDLVLLDIYKNNFFKRDFYYSGVSTDSSVGSLHLDAANYIILDGAVLKVKKTPNIMDTTVVNVPENLSKYSLDKVDQDFITRSSDVEASFNQIRYAYLVYINLLLEKGKWKEAVALWTAMGQRLPLERLPLPDEYREGYEKLQEAIEKSKQGQNE